MKITFHSHSKRFLIIKSTIFIPQTFKEEDPKNEELQKVAPPTYPEISLSGSIMSDMLLFQLDFLKFKCLSIKDLKTQDILKETKHLIADLAFLSSFTHFIL